MKEKLDRLLYNGSIHTLKSENDVVEALGINDGKIVFVGRNCEAFLLYEPLEMLDLKGKTVIPGLGDSHMHFYATCQTLATVDLGGCRSKREAMLHLKEKAVSTPKGEWIRGSNFDQSKWHDSADALPTRKELDAVSTEHPIVIKRTCLHTVVANTMALEKAGIGKGYTPESGGVVEFEEDGYPNGILREQATKVFDEIIPDPLSNPEYKRNIMAAELQKMASLGMTLMHTYAADIWKYIESVEDYAELDAEGKLPLRVTVYQDKLEKLMGNRPERQYTYGDGDGKVHTGGYKLFCDGSLGSRSAALYSPYADDPTTMGIVVEYGEALESKMLRASRAGIQCAIHAIGDRALDIVVTAIENTRAALKREGWAQEKIDSLPKFRIIHAQLATKALIERMRKLPVVLDVQPAFFLTDMHWVEERLGAERKKNGYLWRTYIENGLLLTGGSDAPVESFDPMPAIYSAVTREDLNGLPRGGMQPEERLNVYQAICLFSKNIPYATGENAHIGTLEVGKYADLAVLDRDIFSIPHDEILNVKVERIMLAGKDTWVR
mgnify:FL=1